LEMAQVLQEKYGC